MEIDGELSRPYSRSARRPPRRTRDLKVAKQGVGAKQLRDFVDNVIDRSRALDRYLSGSMSAWPLEAPLMAKSANPDIKSYGQLTLVRSSRNPADSYIGDALAWHAWHMHQPLHGGM